MSSKRAPRAADVITGAAPKGLPDNHGLRPVQTALERFGQVEASGALLLVLFATIALIWVNVSAAAGEAYDGIFHTPIEFAIGASWFESGFHHLNHLDLKHFINDGLMALFFFGVGLHIKFERKAGGLRDNAAARLPAIAALGGMIVPAAIYAGILIMRGADGLSGFGIPTATDIAFAAGLVALLHKKVPKDVALFLLTLAIVDDLLAILIIAIFYTSTLSLPWGLAALGFIGLVLLGRRFNFHARWFYVFMGLLMWVAFLESGVHATLAGVVMAFLTPWEPHNREEDLPANAAEVSALANGVADADGDHDNALTHGERLDMDQVAQVGAETFSDHIPELTRLNKAIEPWTAYLIVPLFALANAGVAINFGALDVTFADPVTQAVSAGLLLGKPIGIVGATWLAVKFGLGRLPASGTWSHIVGVSFLAGIGFTVSLFITDLAFDVQATIDAAKTGIIFASILAAVIGSVLLMRGKDVDDGHPAASEPLGDAPNPEPSGA